MIRGGTLPVEEAEASYSTRDLARLRNLQSIPHGTL